MDSVIFLRGAQRDYDESCDWYAERSDSALIGFQTAVETVLREIVENPERWAYCDERHRYRQLKRYPYLIVYRFEDNRVIVVAVAHAKRRPGYWSGRE